MYLSVILNRTPLPDSGLFLRLKDGRLLAAAKDLSRWRFKLPQDPPLHHAGIAYYPLDAFKTLTYALNEATQSISLNAPAEAFLPTAVSGAQAAGASPVPSAPGGFLNYDGFVQYGHGKITVNGLAELGVFNRFGIATMDVLGRDLAGSSRLIRLDTTWTTDVPALRASFRLGDAASRAPEWGGAIRFGGLQWATNFATQPRFISYAMPALSGEAVLPSTVDVYVNNALRFRREVPAGPFAITEAPLVTGFGEARVVVRDLLGREQSSLQPYYVSPLVLGKGVQDYSYEVGWTRKNYALASFDYGRVFAAATHRLGITDWLTGEAHLELLERQQTLGAHAALLWPELGVFSLSLAGSRSDGDRAGALAALGFQRQGHHLSFGVRTQLASREFTQLGRLPGQPPPRQWTQASIGIATDGLGSLNLGYIRQDYRDRPDLELVNASYTLTLDGLGTLNLSFFRSLKGPPDDAVTLTFTRALGEQLSASVGGLLRQDFGQGTVQLQKNLPRGSGYGYRALVSGGTEPLLERYEAEASLQSDSGLYTLGVSRIGDALAARGSLSGGIAFLGGWPILSRRLNDSFALVEVPGISDVRVYAYNQEVGKTDAHGRVLVPQLLAYNSNPIRIEQADLPFDAQIGALQLEAVPYYRSGYWLRFPVKRSRGALFRIVLANGMPLPAGALVRILGQEEEFPVGLKGEVYVTGLEAKNRLRATWRGQSCEFDVSFPNENQDPLPHLGHFLCDGVTP